MRLVQIVPTLGEACGIAYFAERLAAHLREQGVKTRFRRVVEPGDPEADLALVHHHEDFGIDAAIRGWRARAGTPLAVFAHGRGADALAGVAVGFLSMCPGMVEGDPRPVHVFAHPAEVPASLSERAVLRERFGLPAGSIIAATSGLAKFERELPEVVSALLSARVPGLFVHLVTSPWRVPSPGLNEAIDAIERAHPGTMRHDHAFLPVEELNLRLQAADLLWCWTRATSQPYASGVASDLYASGVRLVAADKQQHWHVLGRDNVVAASGGREGLVGTLVAELWRGSFPRHDPAALGWPAQIAGIARFLRRMAVRQRDA